MRVFLEYIVLVVILVLCTIYSSRLPKHIFTADGMNGYWAVQLPKKTHTRRSYGETYLQGSIPLAYDLNRSCLPLLGISCCHHAPFLTVDFFSPPTASHPPPSHRPPSSHMTPPAPRREAGDATTEGVGVAGVSDSGELDIWAAGLLRGVVAGPNTLCLGFLGPIAEGKK